MSDHAAFAHWANGEVVLPVAGLALDPATDEWRTFAQPPPLWRVHGTALMGNDLVLMGATRESESVLPVLHTYALRESEQEWVEIATPDLFAANVGMGSGPGGEIVAVGLDAGFDIARLDALDAEWTAVVTPAINGVNCRPMVLSARGHLVVDRCDSVATLLETEWDVTPSPVDTDSPVAVAVVGDSVFFVGDSSWAFLPASLAGA